MLELICETIQKHKMLTVGEDIIVALSGGADSVALLKAMTELSKELRIGNISAVHVNHQLRGEESQRDEGFVRDLCASLSVPLWVFHTDVKSFSKTHKMGIEEAARKVRYEFLEKARSEVKQAKIAAGHNADDNAETIIMNLCRGTGLKGLGGIPPVNGAIIRPLLEVSRMEIEEYLRINSLPHITDSSNNSSDYTRNRVRHTIMPTLECEVNPATKKAISRTSELLRQDEAFLEKTAKEAFFDCREEIANHTHQALTLNISKITNLHPAIAQRVIRLAIAHVRNYGTRAFSPLTDITSTHIALALELTNAQTGNEIHLPGVIVGKGYGYLAFYTQPQALRESKTGFCYALNENFPVHIPEIEKTVRLSFSSQTSMPHCTKVFSCDKITTALHFRTRLPGDKISLKNAAGKIFTKKMKDYFTDEKIPRACRSEIPLLAHGNDILWILDKKNRTNAKFEAVADEKCIHVSITHT